MNGSYVWEKSGVWESGERASTHSGRRHHGLSQRRVGDHVIPVACLLVLIILTMLGSTLALFYWFAAALTSSSLMLCPDVATCIVERADAEAACQAGEAGCSVASEAIGRAYDVEIIR